MTLLSDIVETSAAVSGTSARLAKIARLADTLRRLNPDEASIGVAYLSNQLRQRQTGVGYASMRDLPPPATNATLTLPQVDAALDVIGRLSGKDSQGERRRQLVNLFGLATAEEQQFLVRLILGELRQGALEGVMHEALARAPGRSVGAGTGGRAGDGGKAGAPCAVSGEPVAAGGVRPLERRMGRRSRGRR